MKNLNLLLSVIVWITFLTSLLVIILIHVRLFDGNRFNFSFTVSGIEFYLNQYSAYKSLFTLTIASIAGLSGLKSLGESIRANQERIKQDRFVEWKNALEIRVKEIAQNDPFAVKVFTQKRYQFFTVLYRYNFEIQNENHLFEVFSVFKDVVNFFEEQNKWYIKLSGIYQNGQFTYAFDMFWYVLHGGLDKYYTNTKMDLQKMYLATLPDDRHIDPVLYEKTFQEKRWDLVV